MDQDSSHFSVERNRIYMSSDNGNIVAEITFPETSPGVFTIDHTFVDSSLRGMGMASRLVQAAVHEIQKNGRVEATCSYAMKWLSEHKES